jgi:hypothetical protein
MLKNFLHGKNSYTKNIYIEKKYYIKTIGT